MKKLLTNNQAIERLKKLHRLDNCIVQDALDLRELVDEGEDKVSIPIVFQHSQFANIDARLLEFSDMFEMKNCTVGNFNIYGSYFLNGFFIEDNMFLNPVPFMHASHGKIGGLMKLNGNTFNSFVDFEDTDFVKKIEIKNNNFKQGTNLLTKMQLCVGLPDDSVVLNNQGDLEVSVEDSFKLWKNIK